MTASRAGGAPFFIFTLTRSGSTWLLSLLNGQPGVAAYEELFLMRPREDRYAWVAEGSPPRFFERRSVLPGPQPRRLARYLDEVAAHAGDARAHGFKLMLGQLRAAPSLPPLLAARGCRMIALLRDDLFEGAVSRRVLEATGDAQSQDEAPADRSLRLDPVDVVREMRRRRLGLRMLSAAQRLWPAPSVEVRYRDLLGDQPRVMRTILDTLGVAAPAAPVESPLKRRTRKPYDELIVNFDEVRDAVVAAGMRDALPTAYRR